MVVGRTPQSTYAICLGFKSQWGRKEVTATKGREARTIQRHWPTSLLRRLHPSSIGPRPPEGREQGSSVLSIALSVTSLEESVAPTI